MNTPKRVSFGSHHGSMVETMIIEEMPSEEKSFYKDNILQEATQEWPQTQNKDAMESRDNPFLAEGELSKKADYILEHSRISRSEIRISDPDLAKKQAAQQASGGEEVITPASVANEQSAPPPHSNGKVEEPITPQSVNVELQAGKPASPDEKEPTDPKKKDKTKGKCCVLQ